jgi:membrane protease YdiL (CAAX protease family)
VYCPECRVEYRAGFAKCSDCLVSLVPDLPPAPEPEPEPEIDYVTVLETANPALLAVAKSLLRSAAIRHLALGEGLQDIIGGGRLGPGNLVTGPVRIAVHREDEAAATELLQDLTESSDESESETETDPEAPAPPTSRPWPRKWRLRAEAVVVLVVIAGLIDVHRTGTAGWWSGDLAARYVERSLDIRAALTASPAIGRLIPTWQRLPEDLGAWASSIYGRALKAHLKYDYPEDRAETKKVQARLAVTLAELDRREAAAEALRALISTPPSSPKVDAFAKSVAHAYGLQGVPSGGDAQPAELPPGWSADTLEARSAQAIGNLSAAAAARNSILARGAAGVKWVLAGIALDLLLTIGGLLALLRLILHRHPSIPPLQTPWTLQAGLWTVVLAFFWTFAGEYLLGFMRLPRGVYLAAWALLIVPLPWYLLVRGRLLRPLGASARLMFGLDGWAQRRWALAMWVAVAYAVNLLGDEAIVAFAWRTGNGNWDSFLQGDLVFGSLFQVAAIGSGSVIIGPVVEEFAFRGVLYGSLRNRLSPVLAAVLSSVAFAATHPYGLASLIGVAWTGLVLCLVYERSRSLVPAIAAHMLLNAVWFFNVMAIFR